ncbi:hypothetical protein [Bosea sp. 685]|uniref:hypothetical protein n=1 Tax=Bosea sp. 685 TaxID=3080057 RepID=UPI002892E754|nr:hypothetical protein [Bosea sp. 685]WNJ89579.1 hypothetical protein RMR04_24725 [Bosea sp. 685]
MLQSFDDAANAPLRFSDAVFSLMDADVLGGLRKPTSGMLECLTSMELKYLPVIPQILAQDAAGELKMAATDPVFARQLRRRREGIVAMMEHVIVSTPRLMEVQEAYLSDARTAAILEASPQLRNRLLVAATAIEYRIPILSSGRIYLRLAELTHSPRALSLPKGNFIVQPSAH